MRVRVLVCMLLAWGISGAALSGARGATWEERGHDVSGRLGFRLALADAPLGVRYFWNERYGAEGGIGFAWGGDTATRVRVEGGFLYALAPGERVNFFLRPGLGFRSDQGDSLDTTTITFSLSTEAEWFATPDLSLTGSMGVALDSRSRGTETKTDLSTRSRLLGRAAVTYYLP